eukprot:197453-Alexandrium_andersonii.AAC.1
MARKTSARAVGICTRHHKQSHCPHSTETGGAVSRFVPQHQHPRGKHPAVPPAVEPGDDGGWPGDLRKKGTAGFR